MLTSGVPGYCADGQCRCASGRKCGSQVQQASTHAHPNYPLPRAPTPHAVQHVPYDVALEGSHVPPALAPRLAFAKQKLAEIVAAAAAAAEGGAAAPVAGAGAAGGAAASAGDYRQQHGLGEDMFVRPEGFEERRAKQHQTHAFPTTTIGSFPQTAGGSTRRAQLVPGPDPVPVPVTPSRLVYATSCTWPPPERPPERILGLCVGRHLPFPVGKV